MTGLDVFFRYSKKLLPYDKEVEYLQSTGTQWIDTGVKVSKYDELHIDFASIQNSSGTVLGGNSWAASQLLVWFNSATQGFCSFATLHYSFSVQTEAFSTVETKNGVFFVNGRQGYNCNFATSRAALFALNTGFYQGKCRIRRFTITTNSVLVLDLIPVRFTNENNQTEGAMYDKVTKQLFRNKGTGSFIIGPDKQTD